MKGSDTQFQLGGERRQVTALFYDIVGSTELLLSSDPEKYLHSIANLHNSSEDIIRRCGGNLNRRLGDGGCGYFGYPEQIEDAAERAVQAALELVQMANRHSRRARTVPFQLRIGVATSVVVLSSDGNDIVGTAPILASRLQAEAQPDTVLVAEATYQLTRNKFDYTFLRNAALKGFSEPTPLWQPLATSPASVRFSPNPARGMPMGGREKELARLTSEWQAACEGNGKSIAVIGDAGIGKSRLVAELRRTVRHENDADILLQCDMRLSGEPLQPLIGFLEAKVGRDTLQSGNAPRLQEALQGVGLAVDESTARSISAFTGGVSRRRAGNIQVADISGEAFRKDVIRAAAHILCAGETAKLIVIEDVHWADSMTLALLEHLHAHARRLPVLVIQTSRGPIAHETAECLTLTGLGTPAMKNLVASIWGGTPPAGLVSFILQQCDGLPLYAKELALLLRGRHVATSIAADWTKLLVDEGVSSLNDLLAAKLAKVGSARRVAQLASVIGKEFSVSLLKRLLDGIKAPSLDDDLAALVSHGVIERAATSEDAYQFRHVLQHEAAYGSLLRSDRRRIHKRIAQLLSEEDLPGLPPAVAAWQCAEAGLHREAAQFAMKAAEACILRSAMQEARQSLDLCAREIAAMPRQADRRDFLLDLLQLQGVVATALEGEGSQLARRIYARAMSLLRKDGSANREERLPLYWGWWFTAPNVSLQQSRARVLVDDMQNANDPETRLQAYHCGWATSFHAGHHGFCLDCVSKGLELYDAERASRNRAFYGGHDAKVCGLGESALSYLLTDAQAPSETAIRQCLEWADRTEHVGSMVHGLYYGIVLRRCQQRYEDVHRLGERMLSLAEDNGLVASQARANMYCGWAEAMASSPERGAKRFEEGLRLQQQTGTDDNLSIHSDMHSEILERMGRPADAVALVENAIALGRKSGQWFWLAELYRRRAHLALTLGDAPARAKRDLRYAVQSAEAQGAEWLAKRARRDLRHRFG
ncbi:MULTISPECIES: AAA family ATPase [unclassified Ensifer]|nr:MULTISPECIES: AAA family ATPase [unclassified Ensifer]OCP05254.1 adenylate cyclase [Ensifer sp. LC14]OCP08775.1 adenylate cyclase [Ensifer sp. LC11]OCP10036.1 adenylate cyclase [Ensifer sp. LC13]OCP33132.1 adenylate cyclase [Ensifer sp. LC499]